MANKYTLEKLTAMSVSSRHTLYKNALAERVKGNPAAEPLLKLLESSGLPFSEAGGLSNDSPITMLIWEIANSPEGVSAMRQAIDDGHPPMAGVDPLLAEALGVDYGGHNTATATAGDIVAQKMRSLGYKDTGKSGKLPTYCIAKTARIFLK